jgi:hypothetical protein
MIVYEQAMKITINFIIEGFKDELVFEMPKENV